MRSNIQSVVGQRAKDFTKWRQTNNTQTQTITGYLSPIVWLSVTCLDAPIVALTWQWLVGRTLHVPIRNGDRLVLFLTAWLIYLADRVADSFTLPPHSLVSARQSFCLEHRPLMIRLIVLIAAVDAICALVVLDAETLLFGLSIGAAIILYLAINHLTPVVWRKLPLKEVSVGFLFALGSIASLHERDFPLVLMTILFGSLCTLNCLHISVWEMPLDRAQHRISFATAHPQWTRFPEIASVVLALGALLFIIDAARRIFGLCIASSATLLAILNRVSWISRDERVALADLVLIIPLILGSGL